jgi:uncharacterized protein
MVKKMESSDKKSAKPYWVPDYYIDSIFDLNLVQLSEQGIRFVALDADSTLVPFREKNLENNVGEHILSQAKAVEGICVASNRIIDLSKISGFLKADVVQATLFKRKPMARFYRDVVKVFDAKPSEIAMVGDNLLSDIWGANRHGLVTVWLRNRTGVSLTTDKYWPSKALQRNLVSKYFLNIDDKHKN